MTIPRLSLMAVIAAAFCGPIAAGPAAAQVPVCRALTLYGNAAADRLCKTLSPTTQNLWVCGLTDGNPDIHTTFNVGTPFHVTVRNNPAPPGCEGNTNLTAAGGALAIQAGQPANVCGVDIQSYVNRLNAVPAAPPVVGQSACRAGFLAAQANGRMTPALVATYLATCAANHCQ